MAVPNPIRKDQFRITLKIQGNTWGGKGTVWGTKTGGKVGSTSTTFKPGGMEPQIAIGSTPSQDPITLTRYYDFDRDHAHLPSLLAVAGKAKCEVYQQPLDIDGHAIGAAIIVTGTLTSVLPPDYDANSADVAMLEVEITPDGPAA